METARQIVAGPRHRGPNLVAVSMVYTVLFVASLIVTGILTHGGHYPSPFMAPDSAQAFFTRNATAVGIAAFLQFGAAIPLGIFAATASSRLRFIGANMAGVSIALFGGLAASIFVAASALLQWTLAQSGVASHAQTMRALHLLSFATGGIGYTVFFGLLVAGVSVISWFTKWLPFWLVWFGLVIAGIAELSSLGLISVPAGCLLPAVRFPGFIWLIATGSLLPHSRTESQKGIPASAN